MTLQYVATTCPYCGTGCSFNLVVQDGKVVGTAPYRRSPVNEGKVCPKGTYAHEFVNSPDRLRQFWEVQRRVIGRAVGRALFQGDAERVITAGIGADLFARELGCATLAQEIGEVSDALPAYAVREVALRRAACD